MRRRAVLAILAVLAIVLLAVVYSRRRSSGVEVDVAPIERRAEFRAYVTASGEIVADRFADLGSAVMGRVVELRVREGDRVSAGQVLARLDPVQARSQRDAAQAQVGALTAERDAARQQLAGAEADIAAAAARARDAQLARDRAEALFEDRLVAASERDAARAAADSAEAQVEAARAARARAAEAATGADRRIAQARAQAAGAADLFAQTEVVAPIDGVVSRLQVREGEMVVIGIQNQPGTTLMTVSDLTTINAEVKVAEADVLRLALDQPATVALEALPDRRFAGRVIEIGTSALPTPAGAAATAAAREFRVVIRLDAPDAGLLRPGLTCDAEILTDTRTGALVAPLQAVVLRDAADGPGEQAGVFAYRDGRAVFVPVTTGIIGGLSIEVSGVAEGTAIVTGPFQVLRTLEDGTPIDVR
jgi:HlyD family secretion protein